MSAERLLAHYEQIADAPDAIDRLRRFILDLAVRGKLVPQYPKDEPASELLKRIAKEKSLLLRAGDIKRDDPPIEVNQNKFPLVPPTRWALTRLATISRRIHYGYTASADAALKDVRMLRITDIQENAVDWASVPGCVIDPELVDQYRLEKGDILIARTGGTIGKSFLVGDVPLAAVFASYLIRVQGTSHVFDQFLKLFLETSLYWTQLYDGARGTGQPNVNGQTLGKLILPLPPLAEQRRIVAKVDELMVLCDRLEAARASREVVRDRLAAASLARLQASSPETFQEDARFAVDALSALTTRPDQIKRLRQTILSLAVRGKLVPQDATDEPASELLKRIAKEKARLVNAGKIKKLESIADLTTSGHDLSTPPGWVVTTLQSICNSVTDGDHLPPPKAETGVPFLVIGNVRSQRIDFEGTRYVPSSYYEALDPIRRPRSGDLLYTLVGSYGIPVIVRDDRPFCVQRHIGILRPSDMIDVNFLAQVMESKLAFDQATACATGIAQKTVPLFGLRRLFIPLPPLAEQRRIVAKVDELMALCDQLEASLTAIASTRRRLLDALLAEALAPAEDRELEAAE